MRSGLRIFLLTVLASSCVVATAGAQLRGETVVTGLTHPLGFVQDPTDPTVQYVVEQEGRIRVVRNGELQAFDFLDLSGVISQGGERGLLGFAFAPDHASSRRVYVNFTDASGHTVVARFLRATSDPLVADPSSRFDLLWPTGERFIRQPFSNHNGGHLAFGPDGFLYIGMGDGGSGNDPNHLAQDPASLLGKMLRIDVSVADADAEGYDVPADNPFVGTAGYAAEIWSFGLRNPWRFSFDDPARGGTGALVIGDVGQSSWEEIDYEPAGRGGRNYGWRNREGAHDNVTTLPPAYLPLVDPVFEYGRTFGGSITGGYVYRGQRLGASFRGRYVFADFVSGRVASIALSLSPSGEATASDLQDHAAVLGGSGVLGNISSLGIDADGELYVVNYTAGSIVRIASSVTAPPAPVMRIDAPAAGARVRQPFLIAGWAIDVNSTAGTGIDAVHVWAYPRPGSGDPPIFVGANYGGDRPDIAAVYGARFQMSGFNVVARGLAPGLYRLAAYARDTATGQFNAVQTADVTIERNAALTIDTPRPEADAAQPFLFAGWAADFGAPVGTGIDAVHVWAFRLDAADAPRFVGAAYGSPRPDVGAAFGTRFTGSGFNIVVRGLPPGRYELLAYGRSTVSGTFDVVKAVNAVVSTSPRMWIDAPADGTVGGASFLVAGWALDLAAAQGTGVDAVHVWAFPTSGSSPTFLGAATYGASRPDVAAVFGSQFERSGYGLIVSGLPPGRYTIAVYAHSALAGGFTQSRAVAVEVR